MRPQRGFTLLELMVAMAIFAMLAVAGWQVFDSVNRARERAQYHADTLAVLQYAYLQLQQDMGQIVAYQAASLQSDKATNESATRAATASETIAPTSFMRLDNERISFIRFADPDPRYQSSPSLQRIEYVFTDQRLIRRQFMNIQGGSDSISLDSVLLEGVSATRWQALLPELSERFPDNEGNNNSGLANSSRVNNTASRSATSSSELISLLPKGVLVRFTYQDIPITWQWSIAPQPLPLSMNSTDNSNANNNNANNDNADSSSSSN